MKTLKKQFKSFALILSMLILLQGCTVYKSASITLEEAAKSRSNVKITTNGNHIYEFSRVKFEEGEYYGYRKGSNKSGKYKIHLAKQNIKNAQLKDYRKSKTRTTISYGVLGAAVVGVLIGLGVKSFEKNCCFGSGN